MKKDYELNTMEPGWIKYYDEERTPREVLIDYLEKRIKKLGLERYEILDEHTYGKTKHITQYHVKYGSLEDEIDVIEL